MKDGSGANIYFGLKKTRGGGGGGDSLFCFCLCHSIFCLL